MAEQRVASHPEHWCLLAGDLPLKVRPTAIGNVALDAALDRKVGSLRIVLKRDSEDGLDVLVSYSVGSLALLRGLDAQDAALGLEDGDKGTAGDVVDAECSVLVGPGAREGGAITPVRGTGDGSLREAGRIAGCLIRRGRVPSDVRAVLETSGNSSPNCSSSQTGQDGDGLHDVDCLLRLELSNTALIVWAEMIESLLVKIEKTERLDCRLHVVAERGKRQREEEERRREKIR